MASLRKAHGAGVLEAVTVQPSAASASFEDGSERSENFQGPHKWREKLRRVGAPKNDDVDSSASLSTNGTSDRKLAVVSEEDQTHASKKSDPDVPPWRKEYLEKRKTHQAGKNVSNANSQIPVCTVAKRRTLLAESAFSRQVINSGTNSRKKSSPSNSFRQAGQSASSTSAGRRVPSGGDAPSTYLTQKRIDQVQRARLYLLQRSGPNSFLIGGDSPDHKFRVIMGPQTCSCGKGPHCVHVLFVMLRVFQVGENDPCLWSKTLKNFEVENLFRIYNDKRSLRLKRKSQGKATTASSPEQEGRRATAVSGETNSPSETDTTSNKEDDDTCPICLLEMLEGESLIKCENSCQNRLHHHCVAIWFEECRRQNDPLSCPLCRTPWTSTTTEIKTTHTQLQSPDVSEAAPSARSSSPHHSRAESDGHLPHAEPLSQEHQAIAAPWIEVIGEDLVKCLFSSNWSLRETGLMHLSKEITATLLRSTGEGRSGVMVSPLRQAASLAIMETASNILAHMCGDPVYRVFVACLRCMRTLLSYTPCRDGQQRERLQKLLTPVVSALFLKCTDGNRRTSQLSVSTLVEVAKGQAGELAIGQEIVNPGAEGLDGLNFVVGCATQDYDPNSVQWQWLLGRLYVIDKLLEEFQTEFIPHHEAQDLMRAGEELVVEGAESNAGDLSDCETPAHLVNHKRLMWVIEFCVKAVCSSHMLIARMSRRVFLMSAKLGSHFDDIIDHMEELLNHVSTSSSVVSLKRKLRRIVTDFQLSEKIIQGLHHGGERFSGAGRFESSTSTPMDSPVSTPRCTSPNNMALDTREDKYVAPRTPPNAHRNRRKLRRHSARRSDSLSTKYSGASSDTSQHSADSRSKETEAGILPKVEKENTRGNHVEKENTRGDRAEKENTRDHAEKENTRVDHGEKENTRGDHAEEENGRGDHIPHSPSAQLHTFARLIPVIKVRPPSTADDLLNGVCVADLGHPSRSLNSEMPSLDSGGQAEACSHAGLSLNSEAVDDGCDKSHAQIPSVSSEADGQGADEDREVVSFTTEATKGENDSSHYENFSLSYGTRDSGIEDVNHSESGLLEDLDFEVENTSGLLDPACGDGAEDSNQGADAQRDEASLGDGDLLTSGEGDPDVASGPTVSKPSSRREKCWCSCHSRESGLYDDAASQTSGTLESHESLGSRYHTAEQESISSDDFLDFSSPSCSTTEKPVSFKTEVAQSPKGSPYHTLSEGDCACKEEVEREEAEALARAMEASEVQNPIPVVPGLTPASKEEVVTIRIQPDTLDCSRSVTSSSAGQPQVTPGNANQPQIYYEGVHWVKGPLLGTGAFSTCYQARDTQTGVIMAVKQLSFCRNSPKEQEIVVEAITAEIHMMSRLSHPNVVRILGATKQGCHFNMFVEWMSGGSVASLLGHYGAFTESVIIRYTRQILRGLAYLHDNHVLHRDLKGANLMVDSTGQLLRIGDFGASARLASQHTGAGEFQGQLLGTIAFMAPEVLRGESYGRACDVWSVGCVMIEMSTCKPPWNSRDVSNHLALIYKIASSVDPPPIPDNLSPPVRDLMLRCLEQNSEFRPSAKDLLMHPLFTKYFNY